MKKKKISLKNYKMLRFISKVTPKKTYMARAWS